jgi:hypothetical protein
MYRISSKPLLVFAATIVAIMSISVARAQDVPEALKNDQCAVCHFDIEELPENFLGVDINVGVGISCAGCHGGDPTSDDEDVAMSKAAGFIGVPDAADIPEMCGKCHSDIEYMRQYRPRISTDQVRQYYTSAHGKRLRECNEEVAQCASCHTAHAVLPATDGRSTVHPLRVPDMCNSCHGDASLMQRHGLRTGQYDDYVGSVHGVALLERQDTGSPACNDCHGNHGAAPPGVASIENVCGMCHVSNAEFFAGTRMAAAFHEEALHGCEECHGIHAVSKTSDDMVGIGDNSVCIDCHEEGDDGYRAAEAIGVHLDSLLVLQDSARVQLDEIVRIGMDDVEIGFLLQESHQSLIRARTEVHTFDPDRVGVLTREGIVTVQQALMIASTEISDFRMRRFGFGIATLLITVLTVALYFKIKDIESRKS